MHIRILFTTEQAQQVQGTDGTADQGGKGHTFYTEVQLGDEEEVQQDIDDAAEGHDVERTTGVALASQDGTGKIEEHDERHAQEIDAEVKGGQVQNLCRGAQQTKQWASYKPAQYAEKDSADERECDGRVYGFTAVLGSALTYVTGNDYIGTHGEANEEIEHEVDDKGIGTNCCHGLTAGKTAYYGYICGIQELLQEGTDGNRQRKKNKLNGYRAVKHINMVGLSHVLGLIDSGVDQGSHYGSQEWANYRYPAVTPVASLLTLDREQSVCQTWSQITGCIHGITCGST